LSIFGAEVIGTAILILLGNGVVAGVLLNLSKAQNAGWIVITFGWGIGVMAGAYAVGQFSGAHINPAVTLGFAFQGSTEWGDVPEYLAGEFVGAFVGATLVWLAYLQHWGATEDPGLKLACYSTAPAIRNPVSNMITEIIGTFVLVFVILSFGNSPVDLGPLGRGKFVIKKCAEQFVWEFACHNNQPCRYLKAADRRPGQLAPGWRLDAFRIPKDLIA
jgi:glycerol uptake facilitator protein